VQRWEDETGIELDDDAYERMVLLGDLCNIPPSQAYAETDEGRDDERFIDLAERIAQGEGRRLTRAELEALAEADEQAALRGEDTVDTSGAILDLDDSTQRAEYIGERLQVPQEREQPSANVLDPATGEEKPGFNLDDSNERAEVIDRLLQGQDTSTYDNSYEETD
jgi:hypothetical protein